MQLGNKIVWTLLMTFLLQSYSSYGEPFERKMIDHVIDGDTILFISGESGRLIGIDAPERNQLFYSEATEFLGKMLTDPNVNIEYDKDKRDKYGRLLIYLYLPNGANVNDIMLENGLAKIYFFPPNLAQREKMIAIQREALEKRIGLWEIEPEGDEEYYVGDPKTLLFHRPSDKIVKKIKRPVIFKTRFDAFGAGYGVHRPCHP